MPTRKKALNDPRQRSLFEILADNPERLETMRAYSAIANSKAENWRGLTATPAGSLLEKVILAFRQSTDIPLEIPFFTTLHWLSSILIDRRITIDIKGQKVNPDLWSIILADSGAGKTFTSSQIAHMTGHTDTFPEPAGGAAFMVNLSQNNRSLWLRDEFGKFLKSLETNNNMAEIKDYLLRVKDGKTIKRTTKKDSIVVDDPCLTILGLSVLETFKNEVGSDSMVDGFAQRFSLIIAKEDPARKFGSVPLYTFSEEHRMDIRDAWDETLKAIEHNEYTINDGAEKAFIQSFKTMIPDTEKVPISFFRRIMFRAWPYALLYHILLGKTSPVIDNADIGWAARVCALHIQDAATLLADHDLPALERILQRAEEIRDRAVAEKRECKPRDIVRGVHGVRSTAEANAILHLINNL